MPPPEPKHSRTPSPQSGLVQPGEGCNGITRRCRAKVTSPCILFALAGRMNAPDSLLSAELQELSLLLRYPRWMRWVVAATIAGSIFFVVLPLCALVARISEDRQEKEWGAITFLVLGCGSSAVYLIRHFRGFSEPVKVSKDMLAHRSTQMQWSDVTSAWDSGFFNMLRIKE
jgi:hypothetical protein